MSTPIPSLATPASLHAGVDDWLAEPADRGAELLNGLIVYKAMPTFRHGRAQARIAAATNLYDRQHQNDAPGWWLATEVDILLAPDGVRPDVVGWRRDLHPEPPAVDPMRKVITTPPNWVCEVLSPTTAHRDLSVKLRIYHRSQVAHYWVVDPATQVLTVYLWQPLGYLLLLAAHGTEPVSPEPFPATSLVPADLFIEEP